MGFNSAFKGLNKAVLCYVFKGLNNKREYSPIDNTMDGCETARKDWLVNCLENVYIRAYNLPGKFKRCWKSGESEPTVCARSCTIRSYSMSVCEISVIKGTSGTEFSAM